MLQTREQALVMKILLILVGILNVNSAPSVEYLPSINAQEQVLGAKGPTELHKCLDKHCFFHSSIHEFLACAQDNCIGDVTWIQKRWIDSSYYPERRRSVDDRVGSCIRTTCSKDLTEAELGLCAVNCRTSGKIKETKRDWLDPTQFRERKKDQGRVDKGNKGIRAFLEESMSNSETEFENMVENKMDIGYDLSLKPRWLDPMVYNSKTGKTKNSGKRNYLYNVENLRPEASSELDFSDTNELFSAEEKSCVYRCNNLQTNLLLEDCLRKCLLYNEQTNFA